MTPSGELVGVARAPHEALRLLAELEDAWTLQGRAWAIRAVEGARTKLRAGELNGSLWIGPKDEAVGLATWDADGEVGRRISTFLSEGYRNEATFRAFVSALVSEGDRDAAPVISWSDEVPGIPLASQARVLEPFGAFHVTRIDLAYPLLKPLFAPVGAAPDRARSLTMEDEPRLARLLREAYADNPVEQAVFVRWKDPVRDARESAHDLLHGKYGRWMSDASFGVAEGEELAAAVLVNDYHGPLVTEVMTAPGHRRRGLASHLLRSAVSALRAQSAPAPRLVVTTWNQRALRLYERLGFERVPGSEGGYWLDLPRLGLTRPESAPGT
ncbi:MAG: GNAT family N-acetyltransferase [Thermoplasmata archaeon]|nr:GNAT family N-acetyltransferase [Thermoplasmata archaeon]